MAALITNAGVEACTIQLDVQLGAKELKTDRSGVPIPASPELVEQLLKSTHGLKSDHLVVGVFDRPIAPYTLETHFREARETIKGLPEGSRFHDLRHYFASLLIAAGLDVKVVQSCLRHGSAKTTLETYGHMFPDKNEAARAAVTEVLAARAAIRAD